jgi:hypothetical protein
MGATKKPRKRYTPRAMDRDPIARLRAAPEQDRTALYLRQVTALESIARCSVASRSEIAELADCINTLQTMVETMGLLDASECMPVVQAASQALQQAAHRNATHGAARVDGPGLQALRDAVELFETVAASASHRAMSTARDLTEQRVRQLLRTPRPDTVVLEV